MRVTNNMMLKQSANNINKAKESVSDTMNQMTSQKKITVPSDDPIVAIRSLRISTSLSKVNQYYENNIPDAQSWLDVTETALINIKTIMTDIKTLCTEGASDNLSSDDRNTIVTQIKALQEQLYAEGNADYAGRTVFTGYRTNQTLSFSSDETDTSYDINQTFSYTDLESVRYYSTGLEIPATMAEVLATDNITDTTEYDSYRIQLAYNNVTELQSFSYSYDDTTVEFTEGDNLYIYENEEEWEEAMGGKTVPDGCVVFIKSTGDLVLADDVATDISSNRASISVDYNRTGFSSGELRPEYYYNCTDVTDPDNTVTYTKFDEDGNEISQEIQYTIATNQTLTVNTNISDVFNSDLLQDVNDLVAAMDACVAAHDKVTAIENMMKESQYADEESQAALAQWLEAAQKEADYADDNMQKLFSSMLTNVESYFTTINNAITKVGCTVQQLELTEDRMSNQQITLEELQSENDDLDISEIIINYTAAYNAYQASLTAASKLGNMSLLNYM